MKRLGILLLSTLLLVPVPALAQAPQPQSGARTRNTVVTLGISTAAVLLPADPNRLSGLCVNTGTITVFLGADLTVTTANGIPLQVGQSLALDRAPAVGLFGIASAAGEIRCFEELR